MQSVRIIFIPDCRMVASCIGMFGMPEFDGFMDWMSKQKSPQTEIYPRDFLSGDSKGLRWYYLYHDGMDTENFDVVDFKGGLYAVTTGIDQRTNMDEMKHKRDEFLNLHRLVHDGSRPELGNIISSKEAVEVMGYEQMDYYYPVKKAE